MISFYHIYIILQFLYSTTTTAAINITTANNNNNNNNNITYISLLSRSRYSKSLIVSMYIYATAYISEV